MTNCPPTNGPVAKGSATDNSATNGDIEWHARLRRRYTQLSLITPGGMADIFKAAATAETDFHRQEIEVGALARLTHPNLVTLLDAPVDRTDPVSPAHLLRDEARRGQ